VLHRTIAFLLLAATAASAIPVPIHAIQGAGPTSPLAGEVVTTTGVVTAVDSRGFWLQDPLGDGDPVTSEGLFVYTGFAPPVAVGDSLRATGRVVEYAAAFGVDVPGRMTVTELVRPWPEPLLLEPLAHDGSFPDPVRIGVSARLPPTELVRPDGFAFWESLEGMLVTIEDAQAVAPRRGSGELAVVASRGAGATGMNPRGGLTALPGDESPEWILVRRDAGIADVTVPFADVGDLLGDVTGVLGSGLAAYEVYPTTGIEHVSVGLRPEVASVADGPGRLRVASYNVWNLDPGDPRWRYEALGRDVVEGLGAPSIVALQEIQDDDGAPAGLTEEEARAVSSVVSAEATYARLLDAIVAAGGPRYEVAQVDPEDDADGGQPGGNIRVAFLWDPARVRLTSPAIRLPGSEESPGPFVDARKPLVAEFSCGGERVTVVNVHLSSKHGSAPLYGTGEPVNAGHEERSAQAAFVDRHVRARLEDDPGARVVVLGDFNETMDGLPILSGGTDAAPALWNASLLLDPLERYSYVHGGTSQQLDHALVSEGLWRRGSPDFQIVHRNAEFYGSPSDHDPIVLSVWIPEPGAGVLVGVGAALLLALIRRRS
jgi:predicted extracellular nuclease